MAFCLFVKWSNYNTCYTTKNFKLVFYVAFYDHVFVRLLNKPTLRWQRVTVCHEADVICVVSAFKSMLWQQFTIFFWWSWNIEIEILKCKIALENACSQFRKLLGTNRPRQPWNLSLFTIHGTNAFSSLNIAEEPFHQPWDIVSFFF